MCRRVEPLRATDQHFAGDWHESTGEKRPQRSRVAGGDLSPAAFAVRDELEASRDQPPPSPCRRDVRLEQLDRQLPPADKAAAEDHQTVVVAVDLDIATMSQRTAHPRVVTLIVTALQRPGRGQPTRGGEHDVERTDLAVVAREPLLYPRRHRAAEPPAGAVGLALGDLGRVDVGEHDGMSGEGDDRERAVDVGGQHVRAAIRGRELPSCGTLEDGGERVHRAEVTQWKMAEPRIDRDATSRHRERMGGTLDIKFALRIAAVAIGGLSLTATPVASALDPVVESPEQHMPEQQACTVDAVDDTHLVLANDDDTQLFLPTENDVIAGCFRSCGSCAYTRPAHGTVTTFNDGGYLRYDPDDGFAGVDTFTYFLEGFDEEPFCCPVATDTATITITVIGEEPPPPCTVDTVDDAFTVNTNATLDASVSANDTTTCALRSFAIIEQPSHGTASIDTATGQLTYAPSFGFSGTDSLRYSFQGTGPSAAGDNATVTISVVIPPCAVDATDDTATMGFEQFTVTVAPSANDTIDGCTSHCACTFTQPANGTVTRDAATDTFTYTPNAGFNGTDTFTYTQEGYAPIPICCPVDTDTATVTITVTVPPPCVIDTVDDSFTIEAGTTLNGSTADNDTFTNCNPPFLQDYLVQPQHGEFVGGAFGGFLYTPDPGFTGTDSFRYSRTAFGPPPASPAVSDTATVTITVTEPPPPPQCTVDAVDREFTTGEDETLTAPIAGSTSNCDLVFTGYTVTTPPQHGSVTVSPFGEMSYTPDPGFSGDDSFTFTLSGSSLGNPTGNPPIPPSGDEDTAAVTIHVLAACDSVAVDDTFAAQADSDLTVTAPGVLGNDTACGAAAAVASEPLDGTLTLDPDGGFVYTPNPGFVGTDTFSYQLGSAATFGWASPGVAGTGRRPAGAADLTGTVTIVVTADPPPPTTAPVTTLPPPVTTSPATTTPPVTTTPAVTTTPTTPTSTTPGTTTIAPGNGTLPATR